LPSASATIAIRVLIAVSGLLYALFNAITEHGASWFYRSVVTNFMKDALILGFFPLAGAGLLIWVVNRAIVSLIGAESWILVALVVIGIVMMLTVARVFNAPIFSIKMQVAETVAATLNVGTD